MTANEAVVELGIDKTQANEPDLKKAYLRLVNEWHPDRNKTPEALAKTQRINAAYTLLLDVLKNPKKYEPVPVPTVVVYATWSYTTAGTAASNATSYGGYY